MFDDAQAYKKFFYFDCSRVASIGINLMQPMRGKKDDSSPNISSLFRPIPIKPNPDDINVGAELTTTLKKSDLLKILNSFVLKKEVRALAMEYGLDSMFMFYTNDTDY